MRHRSSIEVLVMVEIMLTPDQVAALKGARGKVRFKSEDGQFEIYASAVVRPVDWTTLPQSEKDIVLSRLQNPQGEFFTADEIIERMKKRFPE
ncbi:MAG TPA: hypothetical protein VM510_09615 [Caulifigura sp.]|nr:hypothetical protein [Caulifigura sp.]